MMIADSFSPPGRRKDNSSHAYLLFHLLKDDLGGRTSIVGATIAPSFNLAVLDVHKESYVVIRHRCGTSFADARQKIIIDLMKSKKWCWLVDVLGVKAPVK